MKTSFLLITVLAIFVQNTTVIGDSGTEPGAAMDNQRLDELIKRIDSEAEGRPGYWALRYRDIRHR